VAPKAPRTRPGDSAAPPRVRRAEPHDAAALAAIDRRCFRFEGERFAAPRIRRLIGNPRAAVLVAEIDRSLVAWAVGLHRTARSGRVHGRVYGLAVDRSARGRGLGRLLLRRLLAALRGQGAAAITLEVRCGNRAARRLYERHGFAVVGRLIDYYAPGVDGERMRLEWPAGAARLAGQRASR